MVNGKRLRISEYKEMMRSQKQADAVARGRLWFSDQSPGVRYQEEHVKEAKAAQQLIGGSTAINGCAFGCE